ncbi:MAG: stage II sporulation protein P [Clostridiales bacterium]|nr:stage II sporulation protein P [Candidatus Cacconaster stercorequi]
MKVQKMRRSLALVLSAATLWTVAAAAHSATPNDAWQALRDTRLPQLLVRWELGDWFDTGGLPLSALLTLRQSPVLMAQRITISDTADKDDPDDDTADDTADDTDDDTADDPDADDTDEAEKPPTLPASTVAADLKFKDNGAPSETVIPPSKKGYSVTGKVYIKNTSVQSLNMKMFSGGTFDAALSDDGPQVLIIHTHASEAYTMPKGEKYEGSGYYRTTDTDCNMVRVGDEIAAVLSQNGIAVLHDRTLHDVPSYDAAYDSSLDAMEDYMDKYPSLSFILDVHRDAIEDEDGRQYKLVSREDPHAAQLSLVMGSDYDNWQENLKLAVAVQRTILADHPTLMRPITLRNSGYNQEVCTGSMLVEVGTAGNSLDEAIYAGRLFAQGLADTLLKKSS